MAKVLKIDKDKCLGCGTCVSLCPGVFALGEDGKAKVESQEGDTEKNIQNTIDSCPAGAISWENEQ